MPVFEKKDTSPTTELDRDLDARLNQAKLDVTNDADDLSDQRDKANGDMRFLSVTGGMWEDWMGTAWDDRTRLEFDTVSDFVNRYLGEWNQNRMDVEFHPDDSATTDDMAEVLNGIYRANFRDESGKMALDQAVREQVICGYGCIKIATRFVDEEDPENDMQTPVFTPVYNAYNMVFWDRAALRVDKKDAKRCVVLEPFTPDSFEAEYPGESQVSAFTPHTKMYNDFSLRTKKIIYVATRYDIVKKKTKFHIYANLKTEETESYSEEDWKDIRDELDSDPNRKKIRTRVIVDQFVEKSVFSGEKYLEKPRRIAGKFIPIIPFYAYRTFVDGIERYHGLVRKLMDPQRLFNMQMSQLAENSASSGQDVPIFDPDQMPDNLANLWAERNNKPYMLAKALTDPQTGEIVANGPLGYLKPPQLDGSTAALLQIVPQFIQQVTGGLPQEIDDPDASGKAIVEARKRENMKTQTVMDNAKSSIEWLGDVWLSIMQDTLTERRVIRVLGEDGAQSQITLQDEVMDKETGRMVIANDFTDKKFKVYSGVGPQYETLREQSVEDMKDMVELLIKSGEAGAKYVPIVMAMMLENVQGVGLSDFKKRIRMDLVLQGVKKPQTDEEFKMLEQAQAQAQQPSPQDQLLIAATKQAESEGEKFLSEARNLDSKSVQNIADARKKAAETRKILSEIGITKTEVMRELLSASLKRAERLPFPGERTAVNQ